MAKVQVNHIDDDQLEVLVDGKLIAWANHDEDGRQGMGKVEELAEAMAKALGADFEHIGMY